MCVLGEAVLTSTHNVTGVYFIFLFLIQNIHHVCFGSKIRKLGIPLQTTVFLYKSYIKCVYLLPLVGLSLNKFNGDEDIEYCIIML